MHVGAKLAIAGAALGGATVLAYLFHERRVQREAHEELLALRATLTPETTHADLQRQVGHTRHLSLLETGRHVAVLTPLASDAARWILWLEYRDEWPCSAKLRIYDEKGTPTEGGPPDLAFPCDAAEALQNNPMPTAPAQAMERRS